MMPVPYILLGCGGHAKVLLEIAQLSGYPVPVAVLDADPLLWGTQLEGVPVAGGDDRMKDLLLQGISHFVVGLGGVKDNRPRQRLYEMAVSTGFVPLTLTHPSAVFSKTACSGPGLQQLPLSVVNAGVRLGVNVLINSGTIVEHDCLVGDHVHVASGARIASTVEIGIGVHIGIGAVIKQCLRIGDYAVVGAGAVVVEDVPAGYTVVGVPARVQKR
jgi:sugar O-acyltransferase (sialic acid O-acetyltransferase NeuD family)